MVIMEATDLAKTTVATAPWMMIPIFKNSDTAMVSSTGLTEHTTRVSGTSIKRRAKEHSGMPKVTYTKASLRMIWPMDTANIRTLTDPSTKVSSKTMFKKDMVKKSGLTERSTSART